VIGFIVRVGERDDKREFGDAFGYVGRP